MKSFRTKAFVASAVLVGLLAAGVLPSGEPSKGRSSSSHCFMGLGDLPGGYFDSVATGVSADGRVVVGQSNSAAGAEAFRWTRDGGMVGLGFVRAAAVSGDGSHVAGYRIADNLAEPVRWTEGRGIQSSARLEGSCGEALGIAGDGSTVVGLFCPQFGGADRTAFVWTPLGGIVHPTLPNGACGAEALAASADGRVVVGVCYHESGHNEALLWLPESEAECLGTLPGYTDSTAHSVSADGSVVVGWCSSHFHADEAFRWSRETGMESLGTLPGGSRNSRAYAVSADGSLIVGQCYGESGFEAFVWDARHGMRSLRKVLIDEFSSGAALVGWKLYSAKSVSADGSVIVGYGFNPNGRREAFVARLGAGRLGASPAKPIERLARSRR